MNFKDISDAFVCPITREWMRDPVIGPDSHTYEREAIEQWLDKSQKSPLTRQPMRKEDLVPNKGLCGAIKTYFDEKHATAKAAFKEVQGLDEAWKKDPALRFKVYGEFAQCMSPQTPFENLTILPDVKKEDARLAFVTTEPGPGRIHRIASKILGSHPWIFYNWRDMDSCRIEEIMAEMTARWGN